ncbi:hypothetical protein Q7C36_023039 [Tachysurus vachellii]|uniref:Uncharacterized protein n=1 Tax=Tachysurus vachellii TaxID=175792 RepID=A0AA88IJ42_TACVA|nr:hypothetical protein Q7C36_023039 [Tachysurus vachellii]
MRHDTARAHQPPAASRSEKQLRSRLVSEATSVPLSVLLPLGSGLIHSGRHGSDPGKKAKPGGFGCPRVSCRQAQGSGDGHENSEQS